MRFVLLFFMFILFITTSCRKDREFVIKREKTISKEEINSVRRIERRLLILRNKQTYNTFKKYLEAKEDYLKYTVKELDEKLFLAKYYLYLAFTTNKKLLSISALEKSYFYARESMKIYSPKYKKGIEENNKQDYVLIDKIDTNVEILKYYLASLFFLRKKQKTLALFKDDLEVVTDKYKKMLSVKITLWDILLMYFLPDIAGGNKKEALRFLKELKEDDYFELFLKELCFSDDYGKSYEKLSRIKLKNEIENLFFKKMLIVNFKK